MNPGSESLLDNRLVPVMREAVDTVRMILFRELRERLRDKYDTWDTEEISRVSGAMVNDIYGVRPAVLDFARDVELVEKELYALSLTCGELMPIVTDSLRMQTICDNQQGVNSLPTLLRAREFGILIEERELPMPSTFMIAVRRLGMEKGILEPSGDAGEPES